MGIHCISICIYSSVKINQTCTSLILQTKRDQWKPSIEQLGSYDPIPNVRNEKLVAFNFERIQYWIARGAQLSTPVAELLGLAGFFPVHPRTYMTAWRNRRVKDAAKEQESQEQTSAN